MTGVVVCVDVGSTFTKAALVDLEGRMLASTERPTTLATDVMDGVDECRRRLEGEDRRARDAELLICSSAGGGLRIAVVGNEPLVTAEAGRRVAVSSGGRVVHVSAGSVDSGGLKASHADVVLLVGGTDGGNSAVLLSCAEQLAGLAQDGWTGPVVVAGNIEVQDRVGGLLAEAGTPYVLTGNVVPRIGVLDPEPARRAIRAMFLAHVIGGKHLSRRPEFAAAVRGATPDLVLTAVDLLARGLDEDRPGAGDTVVVDVGGATTDVYSVVEPSVDGEEPAQAGVVGAAPVTRTVEGDLGVRWSAVSTLEESVRAGLTMLEETLRRAAEVRQRDPAYLPVDARDQEDDLRLAAAAIGVALRRHAGRSELRWSQSGRLVERTGTDLREVALLVASGGVLRHAGHADQAAARVGDHLTRDAGWLLPVEPRAVVDVGYVLAPAGLLAEEHPDAAYRLLAPLRD